MLDHTTRCWRCRHSESAVLAKSWVPFLHLMLQLGTKFPLRCCSKRRWTRSALANQQIMQMRAFWPGPACPACPSIRPWHLLPVFSAKYIHLSSQGSQTSVRTLNSTKERIYHPAMLSRLSRIWPSCAMFSRRTDALLGSTQTSEAHRSWPWVPLTACRARKPKTSKYLTDGFQKISMASPTRYPSVTTRSLAKHLAGSSGCSKCS